MFSFDDGSSSLALPSGFSTDLVEIKERIRCESDFFLKLALLELVRWSWCGWCWCWHRY
jgi:hypothetical protein